MVKYGSIVGVIGYCSLLVGVACFTDLPILLPLRLYEYNDHMMGHIMYMHDLSIPLDYL